MECGTHLHHHESFTISTKRVLQEVRETGVSEGHVWVFGAQGIDDVTQRRQWLVDALSLTQTAALSTGFGDSLGTGQIDQIQLTCKTQKEREWMLRGDFSGI